MTVLCVFDSRAEDAADERREDDSAPAVPLPRQRIGQCQPQREEEKYIHQHRAVELWLLLGGGESCEGRKDDLVIAGRAGQDGGVEDGECRTHGDCCVDTRPSVRKVFYTKIRPKNNECSHQKNDEPHGECINKNQHINSFHFRESSLLCFSPETEHLRNRLF